MFVKIIMGLILTIAVGAIGQQYFGDGMFAFKDSAKAEEIMELTRDVAGVMQTYKAADAANLSVVFKVDNQVDGLVDGEGTPGNDTVNYADVRAELRDERLLKGDGVPAFGNINSVVHNGGVYLVVDSSVNPISDGVCDKINEMFGNIDTADVNIAEWSADLTTTAGIATAIGAEALLEDGNLEAGCIFDTGVNNDNTLVYYVQEL